MFGVENYEAINLDKTEEDWEKCFETPYPPFSVNSGRTYAEPRSGDENFPLLFCSPRLKRLTLFVYTHESISTTLNVNICRRKPLKVDIIDIS